MLGDAAALILPGSRQAYVVAVVAVLGTTITSYCFFWQSSQEAEDERIDPHAKPLLEAPEEAKAQIGRIRLDTYVGMGYSNLISLFIIVTTAATLHMHGITDIQTSAQAAEAPRPVAGAFTFGLFAAGIIGVGLLAVPVLAGSRAYALGEALGWPTGLGRLPLDARAFYGTIVVATLIGVAINFIDIDPVKGLFWSAVINGVVAVPPMGVMMVMGTAPRVMGRFTLPWGLLVLGWLCTVVMGLVVGVMIATWEGAALPGLGSRLCRPARTGGMHHGPESDRPHRADHGRLERDRARRRALPGGRGREPDPGIPHAGRPGGGSDRDRRAA
ncbi:MAG TPA: divalent metal cation transporter [Rhodopila sp.]|nr:divalent metal cation transporter [Rhodopila sp.]